MTPELQRVEEIFHAALDCEPNQLDTFLDERCGGNKILRGKVEDLLAAHREAGEFIETPVGDLARSSISDDHEADLLVGQIIGHYKILRRIGAGGMGAVYLAERADQQYEKQVAIKLIKRGMDTDSVLRHFRNERQILANFDHPNIARLLDGGATEDGLPYFVMEYVEGLPIDAYCNANALSMTERLKLFRRVCAAVSYAHRHTIIHRDIKPSNILVPSDGTPKLLDFGIAKILQPAGSVEASATMTGLHLMTPEYATPEQVRGQPVTTATDVYSLAVVLYQLLTGRKPYRLKTPTPEEISRAIIEQEPTRPSTAIRSASLQLASQRNLKSCATSLRGDLDNIVLMALRKEPARRYQSVEQFSEDIRRHLEALPVRARKDTVGYRAAKFARRNKVATAAAALVLLTLLGGIIATTREAHRARVQEAIARAEKARSERRFNDVRKLAHSVLFDYHDAIEHLPGATRVRERLVKDALAYLDSLAKEAGGDPVLQRELAAAYDRVGDVRGKPRGASFGDVAGAIESYRKALGIREALVEASPHDSQARRELAISHGNIGDRMLDTGEPDRGVEHLRKALALYHALRAEQPADAALQLELAGIYNMLGLALRERGDLAQALDQYRAAVPMCEALVAGNPREQRYRHTLRVSHENMGRVLALFGDMAGAMASNRKALALGEALVAEDPTHTAYRRGLFVSYQNAGDYREDSGDKPGALENFRRAIALGEEILVTDPANAIIRRDLTYQYKSAGDLLTDMENYSEALSHFRKGLEMCDKVIADAPDDLLSRLRSAICRAGVAHTQARLGNRAVALEECRKTIALLREIAEPATYNSPRMRRVEACRYLGYAYVALATSPKTPKEEITRLWRAARDMFQQSISIVEDLRRQGRFNPLDEDWAESIARGIAKCDAALGK